MSAFCQSYSKSDRTFHFRCNICKCVLKKAIAIIAKPMPSSACIPSPAKIRLALAVMFGLALPWRKDLSSTVRELTRVPRVRRAQRGSSQDRREGEAYVQATLCVDACSSIRNACVRPRPCRKAVTARPQRPRIELSQVARTQPSLLATLNVLVLELIINW